MNRERFPSWEATASIARACGADPEVLRKVWEDADARRSRTSRPETLASALRYLHQRAGNPTPWSVSVNSGHTLAQDRITDLLNGATTGTWEDVQVPVQTLDGEYAYFEPLWQQATSEHTTPRHPRPQTREPPAGSKNSSPPSATSSAPPPAPETPPGPPPSRPPPPGPTDKPQPPRTEEPTPTGPVLTHHQQSRSKQAPGAWLCTRERVLAHIP
ncbi:hypothetical protein ACFU6I_16030 [Streptomyces sp. NPDC057486]|uniref:hypothetical protein n=1 Tax=Streptomyces sp. NPDC057486 TaxID=3346145 RepID=UPI0036946FF5